MVELTARIGFSNMATRNNEMLGSAEHERT